MALRAASSASLNPPFINSDTLSQIQASRSPNAPGRDEEDMSALIKVLDEERDVLLPIPEAVARDPGANFPLERSHRLIPTKLLPTSLL